MFGDFFKVLDGGRETTACLKCGASVYIVWDPSFHSLGKGSFVALGPNTHTDQNGRSVPAPHDCSKTPPAPVHHNIMSYPNTSANTRPEDP